MCLYAAHYRRHAALVALLALLLATAGCAGSIGPPDDSCGPCGLSHGHP